MKLILTRHGETEDNVRGILQGQLPGKLTKLGIEQGRKVAQRLKHEKIDVIYSSDLARAADTARLIAEFHPDAPFHLVKELRERDKGRFTGKHRDEVDLSSAEIESLTVLQNRTKSFLDKVYDSHPEETVLFVAHNGISKALVSVIIGERKEYVDDTEDHKHTAVSIFELKEDKKHKVHLLNCVRHLE
ncbi:MAG: histidine phosphatase family protein [Nanoarchaeota archaeon]|nr:histidine phosphatase family protein [Nanoarchaeota archaeon]